MSELYGSDAYAPREVALRIATVGVAKARMAMLPLLMLGMLAGAFIGLGSMLFVIVKSDASLGFAASQVAGGLVFSLGLLLVVVAGAELFTGNNLLAMAWADRKISSAEVLRNWVLVCAANFVGAAGLALLVFCSGHTTMNDGAVGRAVVRIALAKQALPMWEAFFRGILCNVLVCMAVWMAMAGRSVVDKAVAVIFPISAFVAAGFEHSIANMYLMPLGDVDPAVDSGRRPGCGQLERHGRQSAGRHRGQSARWQRAGRADLSRDLSRWRLGRAGGRAIPRRRPHRRSPGGCGSLPSSGAIFASLWCVDPRKCGVAPKTGNSICEGFMEALKQGSDALFILLGGIMVLAMHAGFAFLELGTVRKKNQVNALVKILVDFSVSTVMYFVVGYGVAYGTTLLRRRRSSWPRATATSWSGSSSC